MEKTTHVVVVPGVGYSHLVPILQFSKLLVHFTQTFMSLASFPHLDPLQSASKAILETLPSNINHTFLPSVHPNDLPQGSTIEMQIQLTVTQSLPSIHQALNSLILKTPLVALVVDTFAVEALDLAKEFNMSYIYNPTAATTLSFNLYLPTLDEETSCEYRDLPEPIKVPGCVEFHGRDLYDPAQDRTSQGYKILLKRIKRFRFVDGIVINSFLELETDPITALKDEGSGNPPVYVVGPIIQTKFVDEDKKLDSLTWLDKQQPCSVLYVSFGSGGMLSQEQIVELAIGLELSNHKFLWVIRAPSDSPSASYLSAQDNVDPLEFLPSGFLERTKEQGMVIPLWAPQIQILSHSSVGGFLSHCGWNSVLESVVHGVPLITWPLFAEQRMNSVLLSEGLNVGLRPRVSENGIVGREEIAELIKCLMGEKEGGKVHNKMKELKEGATNALKEDGSSTKTLSQLVLKWKSLM